VPFPTWNWFCDDDLISSKPLIKVCSRGCFDGRMVDYWLGVYEKSDRLREWHVSGWNVSKRFVSFRVRFVSVNFLKRVKGWHETFDPCQLVTRNDWHVSNLDTTRKIRVDTRVKRVNQPTTRVKCNVKTLFSSMVLTSKLIVYSSNFVKKFQRWDFGFLWLKLKFRNKMTASFYKDRKYLKIEIECRWKIKMGLKLLNLI